MGEERYEYTDDDISRVDAALKKMGIDRLFIGGLTTDYCVKNSVLDAKRRGYESVVLLDATKAVNLSPDDGKNALESMKTAGAMLITREKLE